MPLTVSGDGFAFETLTKRWKVIFLLCLFLLVSGFVWLRTVWGLQHSLRWLALASVGLAYLLIVLRRNLIANHRLGETRLLPYFGWGNSLSILRGAMLAGLFGFLFSPRPEGWMAWIPGILYTLSDVTDYLDGFLARVTNHSTRLGEILDLSFDGVGVLIASGLAIQYGQVPGWYILVALARFLFLAGMWLRRKFGRQNFELPPSIARRGFAGLQMGFLAVMLWPLFSPPGTHLAAAVFAIPFLVGFFRDWLIVSGVVQPGERSARDWRNFVSRWLPVGLRLAVLGLSLGRLLNNLRAFPELSSTMQPLVVLELLIVMMLTAGIAGRITSIAGLVLLGFYQIQVSLTAGQLALVVAYTAILFMGSGGLSLWKPEDHLIYHRAGERQVVSAERGG